MVMLLTTLSGCASVAVDSAICGGTIKTRSNHAAALATDGGPLSVVTGRVLIAQVDAGCES
jgi:hypothetical protein